MSASEFGPWEPLEIEAVVDIFTSAPFRAKSTGLRPKDDVDAAEVIPTLDPRQRELLSRLLEPDHPRRRRLA